ncbi:MAG: GldG family protein [Epulopiscium sp.]|nr:GldG family protein [Candidatus Epulonipiscium sp.]
MKRINIKQSFQNKKFKYGGYATMVTMIFIAILLVINLVVEQMGIKIDLTQNALYSLSQQTYDILDGLEQDVTIYGLYETGQEQLMVKEVLDKYASRSKKINIQYKDPILYPQFALQYEKDGQTVSLGSLIVESGNKVKVISQYDLVNYSYNYNNPTQSQAESLAIEQRITAAIDYVTSEKNPIIYSLVGHNEEALPAVVKDQLQKENYTLEDLNLLSDDVALGEGDTLLIMTPKRDITEDEDEKIREFLIKGGRAIFLLDLVEGQLPIFEDLVASYGVGLEKGIIIEGDAQRRYQNAIHLWPNQGQHEILNSIRSAQLPVIIPGAQGLQVEEVKRRSLEVEPLLTTSSNSWGKVNPNATTLEKEAEDLQGPFHVAVAVTEKQYENNEEIVTKVVVVSNTQFINSQMASISAFGNMDFFMNSVNWLQDQKQNITIRPKSLTTQRLVISGLQQLTYAGIVTILIPLIVLAIGVVVWLRRRHR